MKKCPKCGEVLPVEDYGTSGYCGPCNRQYGRDNYQANKDRYAKLARERMAAINTLVARAKCVPCADCGVQYPPWVMDFDHRDQTTKLDKISMMRRRHMAVKTILAEIEKCDVVCANCHRERTHVQNPARYNF